MNVHVLQQIALPFKTESTIVTLEISFKQMHFEVLIQINASLEAHLAALAFVISLGIVTEQMKFQIRKRLESFGTNCARERLNIFMARNVQFQS